MATQLRAMLLGDGNDILDEQGRPIGEVRASEDVRRAVATRYTRCPYAGSRQKVTRLVNASALDQLLSVWPKPLAVLRAARQWHGLADAREPTLLDLCRVTFTVLCLPAWLAFQRRPQPVPAHVAAAHKMCQGLFGLCKNLLIARVGEGEHHAEVRVGVGDLYRHAEASAMLLSRTGIEACAAPPALIGQALRVLVQGTNADEDDCRDVGFALPPDPCTKLVGYAQACADMTIWVTVTAIALRSAAQRGHAPATRLLAFWDPVVAWVPELPDAIRRTYADGALALCSDFATRRRLGSMLDCEDAATLERAALCAFDGLQRRVMAALDRPGIPSAGLSASLYEAFCRQSVPSTQRELSHV